MKIDIHENNSTANIDSVLAMLLFVKAYSV